MVRELEEEATEDTRIVLTGSGAADPQHLERALSEAASFAVHLLRRGTGVELAGAAGAVPLDRGPAQERRILTALALYTPPGRGAGAASAADGSPRDPHQPGLAPMTLPIVLRLALYALVADGVFALYVADFLGARGALLVGALLAAAWCLQPRTPGGAGRLASARLLVPLAALASVVDIAYLTESVLDALVRLLLFLILYKLATLQTVRDSRTVAFLAFFMLVAASGSAFGVGFLFAFVGFVGLLSWIALLQHFVSETAAGTAAGSEAVPHTRYLLGLAGAGGVAVFLVAAGLFFVLPRVGLATLPLRARLGQMITGFSERVELGSYGSILTDSNVVMRVHLPDEVQPDRYPNLRWRGIVLDTFDGQAWSLRYPRQIRLVRPSSGGFDVGLLRRQRPVPAAGDLPRAHRVRGGVRRAARPPPDDGDLDVGDGRHGRGVRLVSGRPAPLHRGVRGRGPVGPGRGPAAVGAAARRRPAPALPAAAGPGAGDPGAGATGRGPEPDAGGDRAAAWRSSCGPSSATRSTSSG